jgi:arylsulfatase A-like enzyme
MKHGMTLLILACSPAAREPTSAAPDDAEPALTLPDLQGASILVLQVDTLRADRLSAYGNEHETFPRLMARDWTVVDGERAAGIWTMPSTASFFTGLDQHHHDVRWLDAQGIPNGELQGTTFAERLNGAGYATMNVTGNVMVTEQTGVSRGFQVDLTLTKHELGEADSPYLADEAISWLGSLPADQPFMLHIQPTDAHTPLWPDPEDAGTFVEDPPFPITEVEEHEQLEAVRDLGDGDEVIEAFRGVYDETLLGVDRSFSRVLDALEDLGRLDHTLVVLTSDHGEGLGDEGSYGHGDTLREEIVRLPLMFLHPALEAGRVSCPSRNYDIWPTLWAAMGEDIPDGVDLAAGCPTWAPLSAWQFGGGLLGTAMANASGKVTNLCSGDEVGGTPFGADFDTHERTAPTEFPSGAAIQAELGQYRRTVDAALEDGTCG